MSSCGEPGPGADLIAVTETYSWSAKPSKGLRTPFSYTASTRIPRAVFYAFRSGSVVLRPGPAGIAGNPRPPADAPLADSRKLKQAMLEQLRRTICRIPKGRVAAY